MKKLILSLAVIVTAMLTVNTVMAHNPVAPACVAQTYPELYLEKSMNANYIEMIIPASKLRKVGEKYFITHPVYKNECIETEDQIEDTFRGDLEKICIAIAAGKDVSGVRLGIGAFVKNGKTINTLWDFTTIRYKNGFQF